MQTVTKNITAEYRIKGSKFLGFCRPVSAENQVQAFLEDIKSEHPAATHYCYAYRYNPIQVEEFHQDDGEPSGTAGLPILNQLKSAELMNSMIIVVRYYGGTKLGKPGLIDAYSHTAKLCIDLAPIKKIYPVCLYRFSYGYQHQGIIDQLKNDFNWIERESDYLENVTLTCGCPLHQKNRFEEKLESVKHLFDDYETLGTSYHIEK